MDISSSTPASLRAGASRLSWVAAALFGAFLAGPVGCQRPTAAAPSSAAAESSAVVVSVVKPERKTIRRVVKQPGAIQAFEQTPIYAKIAGYVRKWNVDIGARVKQGDVLAELWVPELDAELKQKEALIHQAEAELRWSKEAVAAAEADLRRMKSQFERLAKVGRNGVLDKEAVDESQLGFEASQAKRQMADADVSVKTARLEVARQNLEQVKAMWQYTRLLAPYPGVITRRHVNTGDFIQPAATNGNRGEPLLIVVQLDPVRVFIEVPETDADWVSEGTTAVVRIQALDGEEFTDKVIRTAWSLDRTARTLLAEVDLPNPDGRLRPGMYAYTTLTAERPGVLSLPVSAVLTQGDVTQGYETFCHVVEAGKVQRMLLRTGARDHQRVEVLKKRRPATAGAKPSWEDLSGEEQIVEGNGGSLRDGQAVTVGGSP